jgi:hypothetical protein
VALQQRVPKRPQSDGSIWLGAGVTSCSTAGGGERRRGTAALPPRASSQWQHSKHTRYPPCGDPIQYMYMRRIAKF